MIVPKLVVIGAQSVDTCHMYTIRVYSMIVFGLNKLGRYTPTLLKYDSIHS